MTYEIHLMTEPTLRQPNQDSHPVETWSLEPQSTRRSQRLSRLGWQRNQDYRDNPATWIEWRYRTNYRRLAARSPKLSTLILKRDRAQESRRLRSAGSTLVGRVDQLKQIPTERVKSKRLDEFWGLSSPCVSHRTLPRYLSDRSKTDSVWSVIGRIKWVGKTARFKILICAC